VQIELKMSFSSSGLCRITKTGIVAGLEMSDTVTNQIPTQKVGIGAHDLITATTNVDLCKLLALLNHGPTPEFLVE
jgi:hypothetical protein